MIYSRRRLLQGLTATAATGMAGCSVFGADPIHIGQLWVRNYCTTSVSTEIMIRDRDEVVYQEIIDVEASDDHLGRGTRVPEPPSSPGHYVLAARFNGSEEWKIEYDVTEHDTQCYNFEVNVDNCETDPTMDLWGGVGSMGEDCKTNSQK